MIGRFGLLLLVLAVLAGTAYAAADPRDAKKRHNSADQAWAERIRVQRSDLGSGDWRVEPSSDDDRGAPQSCKDPDLSDLVETGSAEDPDFSRNGSFVGSGSVVFLTERQTTTAWNRVARQPLRKCLVDAFKRGIAGSSVRLHILSSGPLEMAKLAPHFQAGRVTLSLSGPGATIKGRFSYYFAAKGRASVMLLVASFGKPISESLERRLATLVTKRLNR